MSIETDVSFWKAVTNWLWALLAAVAGVVWAMLTSRISEVSKVANAALPRADFAGYVLRSDKNREELRESIHKLFEETKAIRNKMNEQHIELLKNLHEIAKKQ